MGYGVTQGGLGFFIERLNIRGLGAKSRALRR